MSYLFAGDGNGGEARGIRLAVLLLRNVEVLATDFDAGGRDIEHAEPFLFKRIGPGRLDGRRWRGGHCGWWGRWRRLDSRAWWVRRLCRGHPIEVGCLERAQILVHG